MVQRSIITTWWQKTNVEPFPWTATQAHWKVRGIQLAEGTVFKPRGCGYLHVVLTREMRWGRQQEGLAFSFVPDSRENTPILNELLSLLVSIPHFLHSSCSFPSNYFGISI